MINRNEDGAGFTWAHANPPSIKKFKNYKETKKKNPVLQWNVSCDCLYVSLHQPQPGHLKKMKSKTNKIEKQMHTMTKANQ